MSPRFPSLYSLLFWRGPKDWGRQREGGGRGEQRRGASGKRGTKGLLGRAIPKFPFSPIDQSFDRCVLRNQIELAS